MTAIVVLSIILAVVTAAATIANSILIAGLSDVSYQLEDIIEQLNEDAEAVIGELTETTDDLTTRVADLEVGAELVDECLAADADEIYAIATDAERLAARVNKLEQASIYRRAPCSTVVVDGAKRIVPFVSAGRKPAGLGWDVA